MMMHIAPSLGDLHQYLQAEFYSKKKEGSVLLCRSLISNGWLGRRLSATTDTKLRSS